MSGVRACVRTRVRALSSIVLFNSNRLVTLTDDFHEFTLNHSVSADGRVTPESWSITGITAAS